MFENIGNDSARQRPVHRLLSRGGAGGIPSSGCEWIAGMNKMFFGDRFFCYNLHLWNVIHRTGRACYSVLGSGSPFYGAPLEEEEWEGGDRDELNEKPKK